MHVNSCWFYDKGVKSVIRGKLFTEKDAEYTGITCLMGAADIKGEMGITFLSSATSKCHAVYYPTGTHI